MITEKIIVGICSIIFFVVVLLGSRWARNSEDKLWNNGICLETGEPWEIFDHDSQGGRGYRSGGGDTKVYRIWISYPVDKIEE